MNPPPVQLAASALVPVNMSSVAITLGPGVPGAPCVADHEIICWLTSCGAQEPVIVQMVRGCSGSVTSASTAWVDPCMVTNASWAVGAPEQLACMAAHDGTTTGLATGLGLGDGVGEDDSVGVGVGDSLARADGDGLWCAVPPLEFEQPASTSRAITAASLIPTGNWNDGWRADVTAGDLTGTGSQ